MKARRFIAFLMLAALLSTTACERHQAENTKFWSVASHATIDAITGKYSLVSAQWSSAIDLSGEGLVSEDILFQLNNYGWTGTQSIKDAGETEFTNILYRSVVTTPSSPTGFTQVNLYVPYPERDRDNTLYPLENAKRCSIDIDVYQFHYQVDSRGYITLFNVTERRMSGVGGLLENVKIRFEGRCIYFDADTSLYDWSSSTWQDGHMSLIYRHN